MEDVLLELLRISFLGSLSAILLLLLQPIFCRKVSRAVIYYLWLVVLLRLCIPVGITISLPSVSDTVSHSPDKHSTQDIGNNRFPVQKETAATAPEFPDTSNPADTPPKLQPRRQLNMYVLCLILWGLGTLVCIGWHVWASMHFSRTVRRSLSKAGAEALAVLRELEPTGHVCLAESSIVNTPMLLGFRHPLIVLPGHTAANDILYEGTVEKAMLKDIMAHELVHAKRCDLLYKWFVITVTSLHWFNPLMLLVRREIDRCCELSCDEAVIRSMNAEERRHYGETLLAMAGVLPSDRRTLTVTLCEEKTQLKERLVSIVKYRKKGIPAVLLSALLALSVGGCAMISNAEINKADSGQTHISMKNTETENENTTAENTKDIYLDVLTGKEQFIYYPDDKAAPTSMGLADIPTICSPDGNDTEIYEFTVIDLDGNGENEVLLKIIGVAGDTGGYMILRQENGAVHGYTANYKTFSELKTDGTFTYISLASPDTGIGAIQFHEKECSILPLACSETSEDHKTVTYQVYQHPASEKEYLAAMERHGTKENAVWYKFTDKNIQTLFSAAKESQAGAENQDSLKNKPDSSAEDADSLEQWRDLYYEKDGEQYELAEDILTGEYLWASIVSEGRLVKDSHGHKHPDYYSQERRFEKLDKTASLPVRRWDNLLYSAGEYLIFEYNNTIHVSKNTDLYHPVLSYDASGTNRLITKVPKGFMVANDRSYEIRFYDENFVQTKVITGLRAGESGHYYQDGLMAVRDMETGLNGFMNQEGKLVIPCKYATVSDFSNGFASVLTDAEVVPYTEDSGTVQMYYGKGGQWGIINRKGRFVLKPSSQYANKSPDDSDTEYVSGIRRFGPVREDGTVDFIAADQDERVLETVSVR